MRKIFKKTIFVKHLPRLVTRDLTGNLFNGIEPLPQIQIFFIPISLQPDTIYL